MPLYCGIQSAGGGISVKTGKEEDKETYFSWDDYEHSWVTMYVEDLSTKKVVNIGSLAFPGKKIQMKKHITSFLEQYKYFIDFAQRQRDLEGLNVIRYDKLPKVTVVQKNLRINGKLVKLEKVPTYHNRTHNPEQSKVAGEIPILSKDSYNAATGELTLETGVFVKWPEKKDVK